MILRVREPILRTRDHRLFVMKVRHSTAAKGRRCVGVTLSPIVLSNARRPRAAWRYARAAAFPIGSRPERVPPSQCRHRHPQVRNKRRQRPDPGSQTGCTRLVRRQIRRPSTTATRSSRKHRFVACARVGSRARARHVQRSPSSARRVVRERRRRLLWCHLIRTRGTSRYAAAADGNARREDRHCQSDSRREGEVGTDDRGVMKECGVVCRRGRRP